MSTSSIAAKDRKQNSSSSVAPPASSLAMISSSKTLKAVQSSSPRCRFLRSRERCHPLEPWLLLNTEIAYLKRGRLCWAPLQAFISAPKHPYGISLASAKAHVPETNDTQHQGIPGPMYVTRSAWGLCYVVWFSTEVGEPGPRDGSELLIEVTLNAFQ